MVPFFIYTGIILALPFLLSKPESRVVLLEAPQKANGVVVTTEGGEVSLDSSYMQTTLTSLQQPPTEPEKVAEAEVRSRYASTLNALPDVPASFLFYFDEGTAQLNIESKDKLAALVESIRKREPCVVDIVGHTDTVGPAESNFALGLARAEELRAFLTSEKVPMRDVTVTSYGEADLLVPTGDGVNEPRNRRVEVIVR